MPNVKSVNSPTSFHMLVSQTTKGAIVVLTDGVNSTAVNAGVSQIWANAEISRLWWLLCWQDSDSPTFISDSCLSWKVPFLPIWSAQILHYCTEVISFPLKGIKSSHLLWLQSMATISLVNKAWNTQIFTVNLTKATEEGHLHVKKFFWQGHNNSGNLYIIL